MNIILIRPEETDGSKAEISGERAAHIIKVLKAKSGDTLRTGTLNGLMGTSVVTDMNGGRVTLELNHTQTPPQAPDTSMILALPRPKVFRRVIFGMACAGIKDIHIINSWRVDKSYWDSPYLEPEKLEQYMFEALMQSKDTMMPKITYHRFFMEFINETLPQLPENGRFIAHPYDSARHELRQPKVIVIGCEGGFIEKEADTFIRNDFTAFSLGERILTTEYAVPYILGMMSGA